MIKLKKKKTVSSQPEHLRSHAASAMAGFPLVPYGSLNIPESKKLGILEAVNSSATF